jgi:hypothetical protein
MSPTLRKRNKTKVLLQNQKKPVPVYHLPQQIFLVPNLDLWVMSRFNFR